MKASVGIEIRASKEDIWTFIVDHRKWVENIKAIIAVEVIDQSTTFLGFKWKETRVMFGKEADETMWVTDVSENNFYKTRAESHGSIYITTVTIEEKDGYCILTQEFDGQPQKMIGKIMMGIMGGMMRKSTEKALYDDLLDIKNFIEHVK